MVLRYKILVGIVIALFAIVWLKDIEFFPVSATTMYASVAWSNTYDYFVIRDQAGALVNVPAYFFVAPSPSGSATAEKDCFSALTEACHDFLTLVARWFQQPLTVEEWTLNYKTGDRVRVAAVTINP